MQETATNWAEAADVTAKKSRIRIATAPGFPNNAAAAAGAASPEETWEGERGKSRALAANPSEEAITRGMKVQERPPSKNEVEMESALDATPLLW